MFKFLKDKIKSTIAGISEKISKESEDVPVEEAPEEAPEETAPEEAVEEVADKKTEEEPTEEVAEEKVEEKQEEPAKETPEEKVEELIEEKKVEVPPEEPDDLGIEQIDEHLLKPKPEEPSAEEPVAEEHPAEQEPAKPEPPKVEIVDYPKKGFFSAIKEKFTKKEEQKKEPEEEPKEDYIEIPEPTEPLPEEEALSEDIEVTDVPQPKVEVIQEEPIEPEGSVEIEEPEEAKEPEAKEPEDVKEERPEEPKAEEKKGFFGKIQQAVSMKKISEKQFDDIFYDLEISLLENNVAVEVIEKIKSDLQDKLVGVPLKRGSIEKIIIQTLEDSIDDLFIENPDLISMIRQKQEKPFVICFLGINGSGKTTTIAKMTKLMQDNGFSVVLAAADTFRAAAIDQLQEHADNLNVKMIKHDYGSDPAAVAFDAIKHAKAKNIDVVLIDTAGRMHSNVNLQEEMKKIVRVANPDMKIFVGESITGNDCVEQAKVFNEAVSIDGIVLSKADIDEKGGAAISVSYITKKPILYIGTGQEYSDLKRFSPDIVKQGIFA